MQGQAFQMNKVRRLIRTQGRVFSFVRRQRNDFNEADGEISCINLTGVYHETTTYLKKSSSEAATVSKKSAPMILCLWEDAKELLHTDLVVFHDKTYRIGDIKNLCESDVIADISLEEVQTDGKSFPV